MTATATNKGVQAPGGLSWVHFKSICADAGQWVWGTARGAFNEKATISQILVDAVIGMIPLAGDVTAARDLIASVMGLIDDPEKRESKSEWLLLVVMLFALIPVMGGVIKGAGRILVKIAKEAVPLSAAARAAHYAEGAREIIAFLNRIGWKNAEKWLLGLRATAYESQLVERFNALLGTFNSVIVVANRRMGSILSEGMSKRLKGIQAGIGQIKDLGSKMIPLAVKDFDQQLREIQAYIRSGGETTSRLVSHEIATGERVVTRAEEARLIEEGTLPARSARGLRQNTAIKSRPDTYRSIYKHEPGYPDLTGFEVDGHLRDIEAFSGKITNRTLKPGEKLYRLFGPGGITHEFNVPQSHSGGMWWGLGSPPATAGEWREKAAVLDEFNRDGFMITATVPKEGSVKAAVGAIAEQSGVNIPGQYLSGGGTQAVIQVAKDVRLSLAEVANNVVSSGKARSWIDWATGMVYEIKPTGWKDANGIHGYIRMPGQGVVQTARLGAREIASKDNREVQR